MERLTLAHDLMLLSLDPETGARRKRQQMSYATVGALLAELALADRIDLDDKRVAVVDATPMGRPAADELLARVAQGKPHKAKWWVSRKQRGFVDQVLDELVTAEVVQRREGRFAGVFPTTRYPQIDGRRAIDLRADLKGIAVEGLSPTSARTVALANLVVAAELHGQVFPGHRKRDLVRRLDELDRTGWVAKGVRQAIEAARAAAAA